MTQTQGAKMPDKKFFALWKVLLPVAIGLGVVVVMFLHDARKEDLEQVLTSINSSSRAIACIILAFACMFGRDFGLSWRFRALTDYQLSWGKAFKVDFLCEFTSCITPSAVGGSSLGMVFLNSQGIEFGRATTLMITTLFLDELFFVIGCPLVILFTGDIIFASGDATFSHGIKLTFWLVYSAIAVWTFILFMGIIVRPNWIRRLLVRICSFRWLRRWQSQAQELGDNMVATSRELRTKPFGFWLEVFGGTALSWVSRYMVVNVLFWGFLPQDDPYQWVILAREFVIWVVLMVSPTPGGAGLSEWIFSEYYGDLVPVAGMALVMAVMWRIVSYYLYLVIGVCIVPGWLRATVQRFKSHKDQSDTIAENKTVSNEKQNSNE